MNRHYHIDVFWFDDDQCWIANFPDLKYCSAHGDTPERAVAEAGIALELWLEVAEEQGLPIPLATYRPAALQAAA